MVSKCVQPLKCYPMVFGGPLTDQGIFRQYSADSVMSWVDCRSVCYGAAGASAPTSAQSQARRTTSSYHTGNDSQPRFEVF